MAADFAGLLGVLAEAGVEFIVIGGLAAQAHGSARLTQDVDVLYRRTHENAVRLASALAPYGPYLRGAPTGLPFEFSPAEEMTSLDTRNDRARAERLAPQGPD